jgi:D-serine dehydratase
MDICDNLWWKDDDKYRGFFNQYTIQVGFTGNLEFSIGIMSSKIGYKDKCV